MNNKHGWIKIVEAMTAILLIAGVVLIAINQSRGIEEDIFSRIHNNQISILRDIQLNNSLREEIANSTITPPIEWSEFDLLANKTKTRIIEKTPNYLECEAKICEIGDLCPLTSVDSKSIYAETVIIAATNTEYNLRQLKLFCWEK